MGMFYLFRDVGRSYTENDAADMGRIASIWSMPCAPAAPHPDTAKPYVEAEAMVVARADGQLLFASAEAQIF